VVFVYALLAVLETGAVTKDVIIFGDDSISRNETTKVNFTRIEMLQIFNHKLCY
jgi:hypothetical protein